jgi:hypothetical protein
LHESERNCAQPWCTCVTCHAVSKAALSARFPDVARLGSLRCDRNHTPLSMGTSGHGALKRGFFSQLHRAAEDNAAQVKQKVPVRHPLRLAALGRDSPPDDKRSFSPHGLNCRRQAGLASWGLTSGLCWFGRKTRCSTGVGGMSSSVPDPA